MIDPEKLNALPDTPMWHQFKEIKLKALDALLMYRMGDFYELFLEDAEIAAPILGVALTARNKKEGASIAMCGVPFHSATQYINKLLQAGKRVAICEQTSPPGKGIVERDIVRIVSPGMVYDQDALNDKENNFLVALHIDMTAWQKGASQIGAYCALDVSTGEVYFASFGHFSELQDDLAFLQPKEVLLPLSLTKESDWPSIQTDIGAEYFQCVTTVSDALFSPKAAWDTLCRHFKIVNLDALSLTNDSIELGPVGAAFRKVTETQLDSNLCHISFPKPFVKKQYLHLDESTIDHLDLFPKKDRNANESLFAHLDKTKTAMGARELKKMIARPLSQKTAIVLRQKAIASLIKAPGRFRQIRALLSGILDLERLLGKLGLGTMGPRDILALKLIFARSSEFKEALRQIADSIYLSAIEEEIVDLSGLAQTIDQRFNDEPPAHTRDGGIFKKGWHEDLDELITLTTNSQEILEALETREREATGIASLKVKFNKVFGFFIEITKANSVKAPEHYVRKQTTANTERFITDELKQIEDKLLRAQDKRIALEQKLFQDFLAELGQNAKAMQSTANALARLDAIGSLVSAAEEYQYVCPEITETLELKIEEGKHPVLANLMGNEKFIANSLDLSKTSSFHLITGPNMAGKSTYMRQSALLVIMAQMGSYIPAVRARIGIVDRIASRVGANDRISRGQSTFLVEMNEMARILHQSTERSFLIVDEIGRGTSTFDGMALAWSIAEDIVLRLKSRTLFATHYHELTELEKKHKTIANRHVAVEESDNTVVFLHKIQEGCASGSYGIEVAKLAGLPEHIIENAKKRLHQLENKQSHKHARDALSNEHQLDLFGGGSKPKPPTPKEAPSLDPKLAELVKDLHGFNINEITPLEALQKIQKWQTDAPILSVLKN